MSGADRAYPILLALGALDAAGYSLIAPVAPEIAEATGAGPALIGLLVATFPLAMIAGFLAGSVLVRRSRIRLLLVVSLVTIAGGTALFVLGGGLDVYFVARALMGVGSGGLWIGVTFGTLERWPGREYLCMSRVFSAYAVGGLAGPALGALSGLRLPFLAYLVLVLLALALTVTLPEPPSRRAFAADRAALRMRGFWLASAGVLFVYLGYGVVEGVLPLHLSTGMGQAAIGAAFVGMSLVVGGASALAARWPVRPLLVGSLTLVVTGCVVAGLADAVPLWLVALALCGIGFGLGNTGSVGVLLGAVPTERIVTAMVLWSQLGIVGYLLGPLAGGLVAEELGFGAIGLVPLAGALVLAALLVRSSSIAGPAS